MPWFDLRLVATLLAVMLPLQALCWLLARGLRLRLERAAVLGAWLAPLVMLAPWLAGAPLLVPCNILVQGVPGAPEVAKPDEHDLLLNDAVYQLLPWELEVRHAFARRSLPFWSDTLEGGSSPWANPQAGVLSPLAMAARVFPLQHHLLAAQVFKLLVAFQGAWLLARVAGRSRASSLLAAAGFSLGGALFSWAMFPVTATVAWVPWLAAGTIRLFRHPDRRILATTAILTGILLLSGHPETAAFGGLFAAVCGLGLRRRKTGWRTSLAAAALAAVLGLGLAAPHVLPFLSLARESQRARDMLAQPLAIGHVTLYYPPSWFVPGYAAYLLAPVGPHVFGRPFRDPFGGPFSWADSEAGYTGLVAFAGAVMALLTLRDRRAWPFLGYAVASLLLAGRFLPLALPFHAIPPLRVPAWSRCLLPGSLALCIAAAFGTDLLLAKARSRSRRAIFLWVGLGLAALASLAAAADGWTLGLWVGLAVACALAWWRPRWGAAALLAVLLTDLVPWSRSLLPRGHAALFYPRTAIMDQIAREAGQPDIWRGVGADYLLYPNLLSVYGVADFRPHNPLASARYLEVLNTAFGFHPTVTEYFSPLKNPDHPLLDFLGVRIVLGSPAVPQVRTLDRIDGGRIAPFTLFRNPHPMPRWFLPGEVDVIGRGEIASWIGSMKRARRVAILQDEAGSWRPSTTGRIAVPQPLSSLPGRIVLEVPGDGERLLATSIVGPRGWSARSGSRRLQTLAVNGAFLGARLPAGVHRIELRFLPPGFVPGCAALGVAGLVVLGLIFRSAVPELRRRAR
jgi:membrane protein YfhO